MKVYTHSDADGIASGVLFMHQRIQTDKELPKIEFPSKFGDTSGWEEGDIMLDMRPDVNNIEGTVIDHHSGHPPEGERKYKLIWKEFPVTKILYLLFEDHLPADCLWKAAIGIAGDGQAETIPYVLFERFPILSSLEIRMGYKGTSYNIPIVMVLSSLINAPCRIQEPEIAFRRLLAAKRPEDILQDANLRKVSSVVSKTVYSLRQEYNEVVLAKNIRYFSFEHEFKLEGRLATAISENNRVTAIVLNKKTGALSVRGMLADYVEWKLKKFSDILRLGGHPGYKGGEVLNQAFGEFEKLLFEEL